MSGSQASGPGSPSRRSATERMGALNISGSRSGSPSRSRSGTASGGPAQGAQGAAPSDPARQRDSQGRVLNRFGQPELTPTQIIGKRVDLPAEAFANVKGERVEFTSRPGFNTEAKPVKVQLNLFACSDWPTADIYQYDIDVSPNPNDQRALVRKIWDSQPVQDEIGKSGTRRWLYDGNKIAWSLKAAPKGELRIKVDLDALSGKTPRPGAPGIYYCRIRQTNVIRLAALKSYIEGKADWSTEVLECMNFLDNLMRQGPKDPKNPRKMLPIKRCFYPEDGRETPLDLYTSVRKGTYSAFRLGECSPGSLSKGLLLNVDIANTTFWSNNDNIVTVARYMCSAQGRNDKMCLSTGQLVNVLRPVQLKKDKRAVGWGFSDAFKKLRRLKGLKFNVKHRGNVEGKDRNKIYTVKSLMFDQRYGEKGACANTVSFCPKNRETNQPGEPITIFNYFMTRYKMRLNHPELPLIQTTRDGIFPLELCQIQPFQRYAYKLDPDQTAAMIKVAVSRPAQRKADILDGAKKLGWDTDPWLKEYGVKVSPDLVATNARLIANPEILFGGGQKINPHTAGRWDLKGKKFIEVNSEKKLASWGFIGCGTNDAHAIDLNGLKNFAQTFIRIYKAHGGNVANTTPYVAVYPYTMSYPDMCINGINETRQFCKGNPDIMFFVVSTKNQIVYERLKKNMDCRFNIMTQMLIGDQVRKCNAQYCSNVAMKVNAKLGGATCRANPVGVRPEAGGYFSRITSFIGLDVSHGAPGSNNPSMAAMTMSMDRHATRYAAACETNGRRTEICMKETMRSMFTTLLTSWTRKIRAPPEHVYYFRDGVDEGSFHAVIQSEVATMKDMFKETFSRTPRFTVIIATKRHHVRFFPRANDNTSSDKNANPLPGMLVEHDATHPRHWDFYISSHVAIQGTARPVHYQVILDEANCQPNALQKMIYHHCYQYVRSTTSVSLHPAVYYAHLASQRAHAHEDIAASQREVPSGKEGFPLVKDQGPSALSSAEPPVPKLLKMRGPGVQESQSDFINFNPWYV